MLRYTLFVFGLLASNAAAVDRFSSVTTRSRAFSGRSGAAPKVVQQSARAGNLQKVRGGSTPAPTKPKAPSPAYIAYVLVWTTAPTAIRFILASMRGLPFHNPEQWQLAISACWESTTSLWSYPVAMMANRLRAPLRKKQRTYSRPRDGLLQSGGRFSLASGS